MLVALPPQAIYASLELCRACKRYRQLLTCPISMLCIAQRLMDGTCSAGVVSCRWTSSWEESLLLFPRQQLHPSSV